MPSGLSDEYPRSCYFCGFTDESGEDVLNINMHRKPVLNACRDCTMRVATDAIAIRLAVPTYGMSSWADISRGVQNANRNLWHQIAVRLESWRDALATEPRNKESAS